MTAPHLFKPLGCDGCLFRPQLITTHMGFEPMLSCVTGKCDNRYTNESY